MVELLVAQWVVLMEHNLAEPWVEYSVRQKAGSMVVHLVER